MLDLGDLMVFTKVVETESLTKAGRVLGLPKSTVSRRMSRLEDHLGIQLLHRSTRAVTVTERTAERVLLLVVEQAALLVAEEVVVQRRIAVTAVLGAISWPVAVAIGIGTAVARATTREAGEGKAA